MQEIKPKSRLVIKISGICGILVPIVLFSCIVLSISRSPWFDWTNNALSDMGIKENVSLIFNGGFILAGIFSFIFSLGLVKILSKKIGAYVLAASSLALIFIGIFPENIFTLHYIASATFFITIFFSLFIFGITIKKDRFEKNMALISFIFALTALASAGFLIFLKGIAIPEAFACFPGLIWCSTFGIKMSK